MKNQDKKTAGLTQIAEELSEEHLRIAIGGAKGGLGIFGGNIAVATTKTTYNATCRWHFDASYQVCEQDVVDTGTDTMYW